MLLTSTKTFKTQSSRALLDARNIHTLPITPKIKPLLLNRITIAYRLPPKESQQTSDTIFYKKFRKNGYTKTQTLRLPQGPQSFFGPSEKHQINRDLLRFVKTNKTSPSLHLGMTFPLNINMLRMGQVRSHIKSIEPSLDLNKKKEFCTLLLFLRKMKRLKRLLFRSLDMSVTSHLQKTFRFLEGQTFDSLKIFYHNLDYTKSEQIDQLQKLFLSPRAKIYARDFFISFQRSYQKFYYYEKNRGKSRFSSEIEYAIGDQHSHIRWKALNNSQSFYPDQQNMTFWQRYLQNGGKFTAAENKNTSTKANQIAEYQQPFTLDKVLEFLKHSYQKIIVETEVDIDTVIDSAASEALLSIKRRGCKSQEVDTSIICDVHRFLDEFRDCLELKIFNLYKQYGYSLTFQKSLPRIKKALFKTIPDLLSNRCLSEKMYLRVWSTKYADRAFYYEIEDTHSFKQGKWESFKENRNMLYNSLYIYFDHQNIMEVYSAEQFNKDFMNYALRQREKFLEQEKDFNVQPLYNLMIRLLADVPSSYHLSELHIKFRDTQDNQNLQVPSMLLVAPNLSNQPNLKVLSLDVFINEDYEQYLLDLAKLSSQYTHLESLCLSIYMHRDLKGLETILNNLNVPSSEKFLSTLYSSKCLRNLNIISRILFIAHKFRPSKHLSIRFLPHPNKPIYDCNRPNNIKSNLATHSHECTQAQTFYQGSYDNAFLEENNLHKWIRDTKDVLKPNYNPSVADEIHYLLLHTKNSYNQQQSSSLSSECQAFVKRFHFTNYVHSYNLLQCLQSLLEDSLIESFSFECAHLQDKLIIGVLLMIFRKMRKSYHKRIDLGLWLSRVKQEELLEIREEIYKMCQPVEVILNGNSIYKNSRDKCLYMEINLKELKGAITKSKIDS